MKRSLVCSVLLAWVCLGAIAARAEQLAPRDIWPQATARRSGDLATATKSDGLTRYPGFRHQDLPFTRSRPLRWRATRRAGNKPTAEWGSVATNSPHASPRGLHRRTRRRSEQLGGALTTVFADIATRSEYRSGAQPGGHVRGALLAIALTGMVFAIALFVPTQDHAQTSARSRRAIRGGSVTAGVRPLLADLRLARTDLGLLLVRVFLRLRARRGRVLILLSHDAPPAPSSRLTSTWIAASPPVMMSAISEEGSYRPPPAPPAEL